MYRTRYGLELRAVGENPQAADAGGINVILIRFCAVVIGGALIGLAGGYLSVATAKIFVFENVPGMLSASPGGVPITERIKKAFTEIGYTIIEDLKKLFLQLQIMEFLKTEKELF